MCIFIQSVGLYRYSILNCTVLLPGCIIYHALVFGFQNVYCCNFIVIGCLCTRGIIAKHITEVWYIDSPSVVGILCTSSVSSFRGCEYIVLGFMWPCPVIVNHRWCCWCRFPPVLGILDATSVSSVNKKQNVTIYLKSCWKLHNTSIIQAFFSIQGSAKNETFRLKRWFRFSHCEGSIYMYQNSSSSCRCSIYLSVKIVFDIYFTEFGTVLTTILPILFQYCYKYCYSDSRNIWAVMKGGGLAL